MNEQKAGKISSPVSKNGKPKYNMIMVRLSPRDYSAAMYAATQQSIELGRPMSMNTFAKQAIKDSTNKFLQTLEDDDEMLQKINSLPDYIGNADLVISEEEGLEVDEDDEAHYKNQEPEEDLTEGL
jgi:hypothetical protein